MALLWGSFTDWREATISGQRTEREHMPFESTLRPCDISSKMLAVCRKLQRGNNGRLRTLKELEDTHVRPRDEDCLKSRSLILHL